MTKQAPQQQEEESTSTSSESEDDGADHKKIDDMGLFIKNFGKGIKKHGYKLVKKKFPRKKKRTCFGCGSTEHIVAECPLKDQDEQERKI